MPRQSIKNLALRLISCIPLSRRRPPQNRQSLDNGNVAEDDNVVKDDNVAENNNVAEGRNVAEDDNVVKDDNVAEKNNAAEGRNMAEDSNMAKNDNVAEDYNVAEEDNITLTLSTDEEHHLVMTFKNGPRSKLRREQYVKRLGPKVKYARSNGGVGLIIESAYVYQIRRVDDTYYIKCEDMLGAASYLPKPTDRNGSIFEVRHKDTGEISVRRTYTPDEWWLVLGYDYVAVDSTEPGWSNHPILDLEDTD